MKVERTPNEIIIRLPADTDAEDLQQVLNFLTYREMMEKPPRPAEPKTQDIAPKEGRRAS